MKRKITDEESQKLRSYGLDWIEFRTESTRLYPKEQRAAHVVGRVNHEERGNNGIELSLEKLLARKARVSCAPRPMSGKTYSIGSTSPIRSPVKT